MDYTQHAKSAQVTEQTLVIGIDVGSETHYTRAFNWHGKELGKKVFRFSNDLDGYLAFAKWLDGYRQSIGDEKVMVGCEPTGYYWFNFAQYVKQNSMMLVPDCRNVKSIIKKSQLAALYFSWGGEDPVYEQQRHPFAGRQYEEIRDFDEERMVLLDIGGLLLQDERGNLMTVIAKTRGCL